MLQTRFTITVFFVLLFMFIQYVKAYPNSPPHDSPQEESGKVKVAILIYDGALLLDYGIAAEMFLATDFMRAFEVFTVSGEPMVNLSIVGKVAPDYNFENAPEAGIVIIPGGISWPREARNPRTVEYLKKALSDGAVLFTVCTGSLLLAKAGFLNGRRATTNIQATKMLTDLDSSIIVVKDRKYVDTGNIVTSVGAGSAIEATLHLIERFSGPQLAEDVAKRYLNYPYERSDYLDPKSVSNKAHE